MRYFRPPHVVWVLVHALVGIVGIALIAFALSATEFWHTVLMAIGGSLVAAGIAGEIVYVYVLNSMDVQKQIGVAWDAGITNVFQGRSVVIKKEYQRRIEEAERLDIMGFGLSAFRQDYDRDFLKWASTKWVRILLLDPSFPDGTPLANIRDQEERNEPGQISRDVQLFIEQARPAIQASPERFQVRLMRALPSTKLLSAG